MARLTLEALERRDLLSANPLAQTIAPPAPAASLKYTFEDVMVESYVGSQQAAESVAAVYMKIDGVKG